MKLLNSVSKVKKTSPQSFRVLLKLGGAALRSWDLLPSLCEDIKRAREKGISFLIVHGGGPMINEELRSRGMSWEFFDGQRVTTPELMEVIDSVLSGTINQRITRALNAAGVPAVGISGADAWTLQCRRASPRLGQVGVIEKVESTLLESLLSVQTKDGLGIVPVISPVGVGDSGQLFNVNADWAASRIAQFLGTAQLLYLTDQLGIKGSDGRVLQEITPFELTEMIVSGIVTDGMLTKSRAMLNAIENGVKSVCVFDGMTQGTNTLDDALFGKKGVGTVCRSTEIERKEKK